MAKITGIGGVFFKAKSDHTALAAWYEQHLGLKLELWEPMAWDEKNKEG